MSTYVRLLGTPAVKFDDKWIVPPTTKLSALLYYLAHKEHWVDRSVLTYLFWSDIPEENARNNLRKLLSRLKDLSYVDNLDVERTRLRWLADTDLKMFREALETQDSSEIVQSYSGELLEGFRLDSAPEFDEWLETERQEVFNSWRETVFQLTSALEAKGHYSNIADALEKLHKADPFDEDVLKHYLRSLHLDGQKSKALEVFKQFEKQLKEELGGEPESATLELVEYIRQNDVPAPTTAEAETISNKTISPPSFLELDSLSVKLKTPVFVARQKEMSRLNSFCDKTLARQHQVAFVLGEAGQGKSSLLRAFSQQVQENKNLTVVSGNCNAYTGIGDPYLPFREILELLTGDVKARAEVGELSPDSAKSLWETLPVAAQAITTSGPDLLETFISARGLISRGVTHSPQGAPWLSELREIADQKSNQLNQVQQSALFEQYAKVIQVLASKTPLLLLLDDVQWIDTGSANLFLHLVKRLKSYPVMIIGAYRPSEVGIGREGERHPLEQVINECQRVFGEISIDLSQVEAKTFIDELIDAEPNKLDATFRATMLKQTGGHPLFTVELLRSLKERGDIVKEDGHWVEETSIDWQAMPALVEGVIGERIGRLAVPLRELLQVASVEGEEFSAEAVAEVLGLDRREVVRQLSRELDKAHYLVKAQGIKREGTVKLSRYRFQHILIQHYLYNNLDEIEQADLNENVANAIETIYGEDTEKVAVQLAHYYQTADIPEKAINYLLSAGGLATRFSALKEAIIHYERGLALIKDLPEESQLITTELGFQAGLGMTLIPVEGFQSERVRIALERALELCRQIGGTSSQLMTIYAGLAHYALFNSNLSMHTYLEWSNEFKAVADKQEDLAHLATADTLLIAAHFFLGHNNKAIEIGHSFLSYNKFDQANHENMIRHYTHDQRVILMPMLSWALCFRGKIKEAKTLIVKEPLPNFNHAASRAFWLGASFTIHQFLNDFTHLKSINEELLKLADEYGYFFWKAWGLICRGWIMVQQQQIEAGVAEMQQGIAMTRMAGGLILGPYSLTMLAEGLWLMGKHDDALEILEEAFTYSKKRSQLYYSSQLNCLKGKWLQELGVEADEVEHYFKQAMVVAKEQGTPMLELQAALSLAKYWQVSDKKEDIDSLLTELLERISSDIDIDDIPEYAEAKEILGTF